MRWTVRGPVAFMAATLLSLTLAVGAVTETADDDWVGTLLVARDELDKGLAQIDEELAAIPARIASDDFLVFPTESGQVVQVDLRVLEDYVPIAQVIAGHPEIKPILLDALRKADPELWKMVKPLDDWIGIENLPPADVVDQIRKTFAQDVKHKRDVYADHQAKLVNEHAELKKLRDDIQAELDAIAAAAGASPSPEASLDPSPESSPAAEPSSEPTATASPEAATEPSAEPSATPSSAPSPCPEGDMWCQEEEPGPSSEPSEAPSAEPAEATPGSEVDGVEYDAIKGLTACAEDDPACGTISALMACSGNELGCFTPAIESDATSGLWSTGTFDGTFEGWGITAYLEQDGTTVTGTIEDRNGPLRIVAEEVSRNRVEGHYFGDVFWQVGRDDGTYGPESAPFDGCPEALDGTPQWGELTIVPTRQAFDSEPQVHLTIEARPCDEDWRSRPGYDNLNQWHVDGAQLPPLGFDWSMTPVDPDHPWTGDWYVDLGSMRIDQHNDQLTGVILSPAGIVTFEADPMDPELADGLYDPAVTMLGEWQGDAFATWLAGFGDIPATWQCAEPKDGDAQWGQLLLQIGGYDREAPDRIDVVWRPCDEAWMRANGYDDDYDWWYDGQDMFTGWRLQPAAASEE